MRVLERPTFETERGKQIYQFVERHGTADRHRVRQAFDLSPDAFREELDRLTSKGYLEEDGATLRLALDVGSVEEHATGEFSFTIRPARPADFEELVETIREVTDEECYVVAESVAEQLLYEDAVTRHTTAESRVFFVATVEGEVVGWLHLDLPHVEQLRETARLTLGVRTDYQGEGIGSQLMGRGLDWADANGFRKVYNSVPVRNDHAIAFLETHGWVAEATRANHYTIDDEPVDEVMMAYTF